jgi:hypothetical protein
MPRPCRRKPPDEPPDPDRPGKNPPPSIRAAEIFTGLGLGELLGLQWQDVDLHEGVLHVRRQWTRMYEYGPPKTRAGFRRIALSSEIKQMLAELNLRSSFSAGDQPVFASRNGKPLGHRNVTRRGFEPVAKMGGLVDIDRCPVLLGVLFVEPVELGALLIRRVEVAVEAHHLLEGRLHRPDRATRRFESGRRL